MKRNKVIRPLLVVLTLLFSPAGAAQSDSQPEETLPGFKPKQVYDANPVDNVNLHNGDPQLVVPLGPEYPLGPGSSWRLRAYYSARIWHLFNVQCYTGPGGECGDYGYFYRAHVTGYPTLGVGWTLEMGTIVPPDPSLPFDQTHRYHSPDGAVHGLNPGGDGFLYSGLPLFLRVRDDRGIGNGYLVWRPDGTTLRFNHAYLPPTPVNGYDFSDLDRGKTPWVRYGLYEVVDPFNTSLMTVQYFAGGDAWKVSQIVLAGGRTITFNWGTWQGYGVSWPVLNSLSFPITGGGTLTTTFSYLANDGTSATRFLRTDVDGGDFPNCNPRPADLREISAPLLTSVTASSQTFSFSYRLGTDPNARPHGILSGFTPPTGARVDYTYQASTVEFPCMRNFSACGNPETEDHGAAMAPTIVTSQPICSRVSRYHRFLNAAAAVTARTETDPVTGSTSVSTYYRRSYAEPDDTYLEPDEERMVRQVIARRPDGAGSYLATKHLFSTGSLAQPPVELERRYYGGTVAGDGTSPLRTNVNCYEATPPVCGVLDSQGKIIQLFLFDPGRRSREVTWYGVNPQGGGDCTQAATACWQKQLLEWNDSAKEYRTERTSSNSGILLWDDTGGTTPATRYRDRITNWAPCTSGGWNLKLYSSKTATDHFLTGACPYPPCTVSTSYSFSCDGFLNSSSTTDASYGTLSRIYTPSAGNPVTATVSGSWSGAGSFVTNRTFSYGLLLTSRRQGLGVPHDQFHVDRDSRTGLVTASYEPNNLATSYVYDSLGRLTSVSPPGESAATYCYRDWSAGSPSQGAYVLAKKGASNDCSLDDGAPGEGTGSFEAFLFDGSGRLVKEFRRAPNPLPGGSYFSFRQTGYDNAGHVTLSSEWIPCPSGSNVSGCFSAGAPANNATRYSQFDFLGRPKRIDAPDGNFSTKSYDDGTILNSDFFEYTETSFVGGQLVKVGWRKDVLGRKLITTDPWSTGNPPVSCNSFNTLDKPAKVNVLCSDVQNRTFAYDLFGFVRSETHPENGSTSFLAYDALGNVTKKRVGGVNYRYTYDTAARLANLKADAQANPASEPTTSYLDSYYDGTAGPASGYPKGRLSRRVGWNPTTNDRFSIWDDMTYAGLGGRLSSRSSTVKNGSLAQVIATTESYGFNTLGVLSTHDYPRSSGTFTASTFYTSGLPSRISVGGSNVVTATYDGAGGLATYTTGNGVTTTIAPDPWNMARPNRISTSSATTNFDTGTYSYDAAGNILQTGSAALGYDNFLYDARSRLTSATFGTVSGSPQETFTFDDYDNMTQRGWTGSGGGTVTLDTSAATNRLAAGGYDARGNLTLYGGDSHTYDSLSREWRYSYSGRWEEYAYDAIGERIARKMDLTAVGIPSQDLRFVPITPCRLFDTRNANGPFGGPALAGQAERTFTAWNSCGIPTTAKALSANLTSVTPGQAGSLRAYPSGLSFVPSIISNAVSATKNRAVQGNIGLDGSDAGKLRLFADLPAGSSVHAILDVFGYFVPTAGSTPAGSSYALSFRDEENRPRTEYRWDWRTDLSQGFTYLVRDNVYLGNLLVASYGYQSAGGKPLGWLYQSNDHLGSPRLWTDTSRVTLASFRYRAFGLPMNTLQVPGQGADFAGMEKDVATGNHYDHARHYGGWIGRFNSVDKVGGTLENPQSWNRYAYARNNPLKYVDPDGRAPNDFMFRVAFGDPSATRAAQFVAGASAGAAAGARGGAFALAVEAATVASIYGGVATWRLLGPAAVPALERAMNSPQGQEVENALSQLSNNSIKHITAHLGEFQKLDPNFALKDAVKLGVEISSKAENLVGTPGGRKVFEQAVTVGENNVLVRVVLNTEEKLRSVFIRTTEDLLK